MMKLLVGCALAALAFAAEPALAQAAPPPPPGVAQGTAPVHAMPAIPPIRPVPPMREEVRMKMMSDRTITRDEVVRHVREMFARFDANRDGYISKDEVAAFDQRMMKGMHAAMAWRMGGHHMDMVGHPMAMEDHAMSMPDPSKMFDRVDTNHDGVISRQEFMAAHAQMTERREVIIRKREMPAAAMTGTEPMRMQMRMRMDGAGMHEMHGTGMGMGMHGFGEHLFAMADANHDGRVSLQEAEAAALQHFDRADLNHDGRITPDERRRAHELMHRERRPG